MGFSKHFYMIFGTNLLTQSPVLVPVFPLVSVFQRKGISNGVQTERNLRERDFLNEQDPGNLDPTSRKEIGGHEVGGAPTPTRRALHPRGPPVAPPTYSFLLYIPTYPQTIRYGAKNLIPPPQPSVPVRSHLGAFSGTLSEGDSITEGIYINLAALSMKRG